MSFETPLSPECGSYIDGQRYPIATWRGLRGPGKPTVISTLIRSDAAGGHNVPKEGRAWRTARNEAGGTPMPPDPEWEEDNMRVPSGWTDRSRTDIVVRDPVLNPGEERTPWTIVGLCSGVGLLERAIHEVIENYEVAARTVLLSELEEDRRGLLKLRFPDVPDGDIIGTLGTAVPGDPTKGTLDERARAALARHQGATILSAGIPCEADSSARAGKGPKPEEHATRHVMDLVLQAVGVVRPVACLFEDVDEFGRNTAGLAVLVKGLAALGYDSSWRVLAANQVGGAHQRKRIFALAWQRGFTPPPPAGFPHGLGFHDRVEPVNGPVPYANPEWVEGGWGCRRPATGDRADAQFRIEVLGGAVDGPTAMVAADALTLLLLEGRKATLPKYGTSAPKR